MPMINGAAILKPAMLASLVKILVNVQGFVRAGSLIPTNLTQGIVRLIYTQHQTLASGALTVSINNYQQETEL